MGANMALRLKDCGYNLSAVFDVNEEVAAAAAGSLNVLHCKRLDEVTANSDVIITVVSDDASMNQLFKATGNSLLKNAKGRIFINCATVSPSTHIKVEERAKKSWCQIIGSMHGLQYHASTRGNTLPHVRRREANLSAR